MRIAHYDFELGAPGGIASYVRRVGQAQAENGHDVFYLCRIHDGNERSDVHTVEDDQDLFATAKNFGLDILHLHRPVGVLPDDRVPTVRTMHGNQGSCPSGSRYLKRTGQPCNRAYSISGCLWGHLVDHCGSRRPHKTWANFQRIEREQELAAVLPTLTVSRFLKEQMIRSGCPEENLHVLHSPAPDVARSFSPPPQGDVPHFVFAGRIEPKKGIDWLLRAVAEVESTIHLDIAGTGDEEAMSQVTRLVSDLDLQGHVTFHGWLDEDEVYALIERARALVFPSVWHEPAGLVTLEAAALGRAVIASEVGGIPEYATDEFALRVEPRDVGGLAACMDALANDWNQAKAMGQRGYQCAQSRFSMEPFIEALSGFYRSAKSHSEVAPVG